MAAAGFIFLASKIKKKKNKRRLWVSLRLSKRKINVQVCSILEVSNSCPQHTAKGPHCAETSLLAVKLVAQQKSLYLPTATGRGILQKTQLVCRNV